MNKTADELAYERYLVGEYTYEDYIDVCNIEDVEPKKRYNYGNDN